MSELETKLVQARTDSKAQVKGHNSGKKELEAHALPLLSCFMLGIAFVTFHLLILAMYYLPSHTHFWYTRYMVA